MNLSNLIIDSFIQKFSDEGNFCAFSLPMVFKNGSPAIINAYKHPNGEIEITDNGLNLRSFSDSIALYSFDAVAKTREFALEFPNISVVDQSIISISTEDSLAYDLMDYSDVLRQMIAFNPRHKSDHISKILEQLRVVLEQRFSALTINTEVQGRSGGKYRFDFSSGNQMIDFSKVDKRKTNDLLRKYVDTQNLNNELKYIVILDDLENDKYKSEQSVLSDFATVKPLSTMLHS